MSSNYAEFFEAHPLIHLLDEILMGLDQGGISLSCSKQCVNARLLYKNGGNDTVVIEENAIRGLNYKDKVNVAYDDVYEMVKQDLSLKARYPIGSRFTRTNELIRMLYKNIRAGATDILLNAEDLSVDKLKISLSFIRFSPLIGHDVLFGFDWDDEGLVLQNVSGIGCRIRMHSVEDEPENIAEQYIVMSELLDTAAGEGYEYKQIEAKGTILRVNAGESVVEVYGFCAHNIELEVRDSDKTAGVFLSLDNVSEFSDLLLTVQSFFSKCPHALFERHWRKLNALATLACYTDDIIEVLPGIVPCVRITCPNDYTRVFVVDNSHRMLKIRHDGNYPWSMTVAVNSPDEAKQLMDALRVNPVDKENLDKFITEKNLNRDMKLSMDDQISDRTRNRVVVFDNNVGEGGITGAVMSFGNNGEAPVGIGVDDLKTETEGRYAAMEAPDHQPVPPPEKKKVMSEEEIQQALSGIGYPEEDLDKLTNVWKIQQKMGISDEAMLKLFTDDYDMTIKGWVPYSEGKPAPEGEEREDEMHKLEMTLLNTIGRMSEFYDRKQVSKLCESAMDEAFPDDGITKEREAMPWMDKEQIKSVLRKNDYKEGDLDVLAQVWLEIRDELGIGDVSLLIWFKRNKTTIEIDLETYPRELLEEVAAIQEDDADVKVDDDDDDDDIPGGPDLYAETEDEEQDNEQEEVKYRPESEFEGIINAHGHEFEGQPIRKVRFSHEPWGTNYHSTAEWVDTPCPLNLTLECWWNFDWGGDFHACKWKATVLFGSRRFESESESFDAVVKDYNETFNALMP